MIRNFFILTLFFSIGFIPIISSADTSHTDTFPSTIININQNLQTEGDGYIPIPYKDRFYYMNHHKTPQATSFGCIDKNGGNACGNGWPRNLPDGDATTVPSLYSSTSGSNEEYIIKDDKFITP